MPAPRVIVTRPRAQAVGWVRSLCEAGVDAVALPLIDIAPLEDPAPMHAAWSSLAACALVVFVSPNAVRHFFDARPAGATWPAAVRAGSTGPGTSAALREAGLVSAQIVEPPPDMPFETESLWAAVSGEAWAGRRVLVVRGEDGRDWLADTLRGAGASVGFVAAYRRSAPAMPLAADEQAVLDAAVADPSQHVWLFSSSEAVRHLQQIAPAHGWSAARAIASHPRIAAAARQAGFGRVDEATPTVPAIVRALHEAGAAGAPPIQSTAP